MMPDGFWWDVASGSLAGIATTVITALCVSVWISARAICRRLVRRATLRLDLSSRADYYAEWEAEIAASRRITAVRFAFGLWMRADLTDAALQASPKQQAEGTFENVTLSYEDEHGNLITLHPMRSTDGRTAFGVGSIPAAKFVPVSAIVMNGPDIKAVMKDGAERPLLLMGECKHFVSRDQGQGSSKHGALRRRRRARSS